MSIVPEVTGVYAKVREQIPYTTGKHSIVCPNCGKMAKAYVSGMKKDQARHRTYRFVKTACAHCRSQITFCW